MTSPPASLSGHPSLRPFTRFLESSLSDNFKMGEYKDLLTQSLTATNHVQDCAIISLKTASVVTTSIGFKLEPEEIQAFLKTFNQPSNFRDEGLYFKSITYSCVRADDSSVYGKRDNVGLVLVKTGSYIICATYREGMYPSVCVEAAEKLGDYFRSKGK
ncbi:profilin-4 isoform X2 [Stegostoma tigrinum]|uniref:profilin-4 isoform X2 n=1 Tax=Stegostoma tigrinum TaxID=3053191 RepID=UPI00202B2D5E|nr:profilin-4 isoform X2 [Stegostoma tigrinum]